MNQQHRPVPGIAKGPGQFSPAARPPVPHPMMQSQPPQPPQSAEAAIADNLQDLAMEIYCRVVAQYIAAERVDREAFQTLALHSRSAAKAYFESMGVQFGT